MNSGLISRDDLRIEIEKQIAYCDEKAKHQSDIDEVLRYTNTAYGLRLAHLYITNAKTVEAPTYTDVVEANKEGYNTARRLYERPQGEWIKVIDYSDEYETRWHYECSNCKNAPYYCGEIYTLHFCPNCGVGMRGAKE